ncbi:AAEL012415-PA [Aedes aegypti]|uniref:AAEL012415-PA n=1 Tax=Aedes aegypti TaxID=7159 RepID=Q16M59_AEDAE|nr:AAEL012415-PA [Aedes aegypti]
MNDEQREISLYVDSMPPIRNQLIRCYSPLCFVDGDTPRTSTHHHQPQQKKLLSHK